MVNAKQAFLDCVKLLKAANIDEALHDARLLFNHATSLDARLLLDTDELPDTLVERLSAIASKRATRYPLQYILGAWPFMGFELQIGEGVLIPRDDTEAVVLAAVQKCAGINAPRVLDLCAGSGAISLGIKSLVPHAAITAVELYDAAYYYLVLNSNDNIQCVKRDIFDFHAELADNCIDVLVSNPPYISVPEMNELQPELSAEPREALTDEGDGLSFYTHIAKAYKPKMCVGGWLVLEIGYTQASDVCTICRTNGWSNVYVLQDFGGNDRVVLACNQ